MNSRDNREKNVRNRDDGPVQGRLESGRAGQLDPSSLGPEDIPTLVHQLHVHRVQLEMQNEELRQAQETLAEACEHYTQLYDFSPAGYVTLTAEGAIEEVNLRFCAMLGLHRHLVTQQHFTDFVAPQDLDLWQRHCRDVLANGTTQTCKLRLVSPTGLPLMMHIESLKVTEREHSKVNIRSALLDVTFLERAEQAVQDSQEKLQYTAAKLLTAQDEERRRIARDLHDDYCQRLAVILLELGLLPKRYPGVWTNPAEQLSPIRTMLSTLLADLRDLSHDLHPEQTVSVALDDALRACVSDFSERTKIVATYHASLRPVPLDPALRVCLYRVTQECLTNIHKHAKAKRASVTVIGLPEAIELLIKDDGQGFVPETVSGSHHLGLTSMRERIEQLDGTMQITSRAEWGTTILVQIPLHHADIMRPPAS
jgi:PAS domain S-box-containing protein